MNPKEKNPFVVLVTHKNLIAEIGGVESMATLLLQKLQSQQSGNIGVVFQGSFPTHFVSSGIYSQQQNQTKENKSRVPNLPKGYPYFFYFIKKLIFSILAVPQIIRLLNIARKNNFTPIIFAFDTAFGGLAAAIASKISGAPLLSLTHGLRQDYTIMITKNKILRAVDYNIERFVVTNSSLLTSVNKRALSFWNHNGVNSEKLKLIRVPVDSEFFKPNSTMRKDARNELGIENSAFVIGFVGRLSVEKNVQTIIQAFADAVSKDNLPNNSRLLIVGDGPEMNRLKNLVSSLGIATNIVFTGFRHDVNRLMNSLDVFVLASLVEGNPTVVLEAMATKVPVIVSSIPANEEFVLHMKNGLLFSAKNINELSARISAIYQNEELLVSLGQAGRNYVISNNDSNLIFTRLSNLFKETLRMNILNADALNMRDSAAHEIVQPILSV
jgi:glycosyltransferase involved in cell wall biosynthesis